MTDNEGPGEAEQDEIARSRGGRARGEGLGGYGPDLAAVHSAGFTALAASAAHELVAYLEPDSRVLEIGCGDGTSANILADAGHEVFGIDISPNMVELARQKVPSARFEVGSFVDAELESGWDAVLAAGEVLGYRIDDRNESLGFILDRIATSLRPGGKLLFDLAGPGRSASAGRSWSEGPGWATLVETTSENDELHRLIIAFREIGEGNYRRSVENHVLRLHAPHEVLAELDAHGFDAEYLESGYGGMPTIEGLIVYRARLA